MNRAVTALWRRLHDEGLVAAEPPATEDPTPWYLRALAGISAWIAALLLFAFFAALFDNLWREGAVALLVGGACCAAAVGLLCAARGGEFLEQGAIALSLAGLVLVGVGWFDLIADDALAWAALAVVALGAYALDRTPMYRFLCGAVFAVAVCGLCSEGGGRDFAFALPLLAWSALALWWWGEHRDAIAVHGAPLAWALSLAALVLAWFGGDVGGDVGGNAGVDARDAAPALRFASRAACALLLLGVTALLLRSHGARLPGGRRTALAVATLVLALLWWPAPGIAVGLALALTGFALARPGLLGVGLVGVGVYLVRYYYQLEVPLLDKSLWLAASGAALLLARAVLLRLPGSAA